MTGYAKVLDFFLPYHVTVVKDGEKRVAESTIVSSLIYFPIMQISPENKIATALALGLGFAGGLAVAYPNAPVGYAIMTFCAAGLILLAHHHLESQMPARFNLTRARFAWFSAVTVACVAAVWFIAASVAEAPQSISRIAPISPTSSRVIVSQSIFEAAPPGCKKANNVFIGSEFRNDNSKGGGILLYGSDCNNFDGSTVQAQNPIIMFGSNMNSCKNCQITSIPQNSPTVRRPPQARRLPPG